jgi:hypothetical protein
VRGTSSVRWIARGKVPLVVLLAVVAMLAPRIARADSEQVLIDQLKGDGSDKVRLAAAVNLTNVGTDKAILPLAKAVLNDSDERVRSAAAVALGKIVPKTAKSSLKGLAVANLKNASENDASDLVKDQAHNALREITGSAGPTTNSNPGGATGGGKGGIYVNVGPMSSKTTAANNDKLKSLMVSTAQKTLARVAQKMSQQWPGGLPSKAALAQKSVSGFYVDGTLNTLDIKTSGGSSTIACKVSMLLADFPDKNMFGFLNGGASVTASASPKDQALASEDCVSAVIEDLIAKKIVPTICMKTQASCP